MLHVHVHVCGERNPICSVRDLSIQKETSSQALAQLALQAWVCAHHKQVCDLLNSSALQHMSEVKEGPLLASLQTSRWKTEEGAGWVSQFPEFAKVISKLQIEIVQFVC